MQSEPSVLYQRVTDDVGREFIIPADRLDSFCYWNSFERKDGKNPPSFAQRVDGTLRLFFKDWKLE